MLLRVLALSVPIQAQILPRVLARCPPARAQCARHRLSTFSSRVPGTRVPVGEKVPQAVDGLLLVVIILYVFGIFSTALHNFTLGTNTPEGQSSYTR
eukprot:50203-Rhodomonas_salina.3